jgi:RNA polymerase sigma-70 factor, ECF subfamily
MYSSPPCTSAGLIYRKRGWQTSTCTPRKCTYSVVTAPAKLFRFQQPYSSSRLAGTSYIHIMDVSAAGRKSRGHCEGRLPEKSGLVVQAKTGRTLEDELALIQRICSGENHLFYDLIGPYQRSVYIAAYSILQNEADAEDAAQEAFFKALSHLKSFRKESKFSTWLIQIAVNEARMKRRKDRNSQYDSIDEQNQDEEGEYIPRDFADWREIPSEALQRAELRRALQKAIDSLSPKYRIVFVMRDIQNLNIAETAAALQISEAAVKTRLLRARLSIRDALAPGIDGSWSIGDGNWKKVRPW